MKPNQYIFKYFSVILKEEFNRDIKESDNGNHIAVEYNGLWISLDEKELTIGYGLNHTHYNFDYDSMEDAIDTFFLLLTKRKKITHFSKGLQIFKTKVEIEIDNKKTISLGTTTTIPLQFWKSTKTETFHEDSLMKDVKVIKEWKELIKYAQDYK